MPTDSDPRNLIVNYIPTPVTDAELRQLFEQFGPVESVRIIVDRTNNHPKGYGFVKFKSEDSARDAIERMNGFEIYNKRLRVTPARGPQNAQGNNYSPQITVLQTSMGVQPTSSSSPPPMSLTGNSDMSRNGGSSTGNGDSIAVPIQSFTSYQFIQPIHTTAGAVAAPTFAIMDGVPVQVFQASGPIMAPSTSAQLITPTGGVTGSSLSTFPSRTTINNGNGNIKNTPNVTTNSAAATTTATAASTCNAATDNALRSMSMQSMQAFPSPKQPTSYATVVQPLYFQPFCPFSTGSEPMIHGSSSSYHNSLASFEINGVSCSSKPFAPSGGCIVESISNNGLIM